MTNQSKPKIENHVEKHVENHVKNLELNRETLRELTVSEAEQAKGGFIMKDTVIIRPTR